MTTRRKISKRGGKKQSRRMKYGGSPEQRIGNTYFTTYDIPDDFDLNNSDSHKNSSHKKTSHKKSSNNKYWLFGGGLLVAIAVGITVPLVLNK